MNSFPLEEEDFSSSSHSKKKYYPFGTPDHGKVAYSTISHLSPENIQFACQLASQNLEIENKQFNKYEKNKLISMKKVPIVSIPDPDLSSIEGMPESEKGIAPCLRADCKEVILSIIEIQNKNQIERDEIVSECEKMIQLHQQLEEESSLIESDNKRMILEGNILELRMRTLSSKLVKNETIKGSLDHERDELNSKVNNLKTLTILALSLFIYLSLFLYFNHSFSLLSFLFHFQC